MYLTGPNAKRPGSYALESVKSLLETKLRTGAYGVMFAPWSQVEIAGDWASATVLLPTQRPLLILEVNATPSPDEVVQSGERFDVTVTIEQIIGPFCAPCEPLLRDALADIFATSISELDALALEEAEFTPGAGSDTATGRSNPHTLTLAVTTQHS